MNFILVLIFNVILGSHQSQMIDLTITVTNINTLKGTIEMGLFNNSESFPLQGKEYKTYSKRVTNDTMIITFNDIPKGYYAISIYHDINADKKCNLNFIGFPVEPFGLSKNFRPRFSKPSFNDCKINANKDTRITINLID